MEKMNFQTDQSNASYTETLRSTANLIGQFGVFLFLRWDKQPEIDCSKFEWQALAVSCMRCYIAKNRLSVCEVYSSMFMRRWWCMKSQVMLDSQDLAWSSMGTNWIRPDWRPLDVLNVHTHIHTVHVYVDVQTYSTWVWPFALRFGCDLNAFKEVEEWSSQSWNSASVIAMATTQPL